MGVTLLGMPLGLPPLFTGGGVPPALTMASILACLRRLACGDALGPNLGLVARHGRQHVGDQTACGRAQVDAVLERHEVHLQRHKFVEQGGEALGGAAQAVEPPDDDGLDLAAPDVGQQLRHAGPVEGLAGELVGVPLDRLAAGLLAGGPGGPGRGAGCRDCWPRLLTRS